MQHLYPQTWYPELAGPLLSIRFRRLTTPFAGLPRLEFLRGGVGSRLDQRPRQLYAPTMCSYTQTDVGSAAAKQAGKPVILEEFGVTGLGTRFAIRRFFAERRS